MNQPVHTELHPHPVAELFPMLADAELQALADDISRNGLLHPVVVKGGALLDGRNRLCACKRAGVKPTFREYKGDNEVAFIVASNLHRRHLETGQRAALAVELMPRLEAEAAKRRGGDRRSRDYQSGNPATLVRGKSRDHAAKIVGVSGRTVADAAAVRDNAPELFARVKAGKLTVAAARREMRANEARTVLQAAQAKVSAARKRNLASVCDIRVCSCTDLFASGIKPDAVITDLPDSERLSSVCSELGRACAAAKVPVVAVMVGQLYVPEALERFCEHLRYRWTLAYLPPGGQAVQQWESKANSSWKPVLLFGEATHYLGDVARSKPDDNDKRLHDWDQSESSMADLVERLTKPWWLVCDPFLGGGTTAVVSLALGRRFVGCDIDPARVEQARLRVEAPPASPAPPAPPEASEPTSESPSAPLNIDEFAPDCARRLREIEKVARREVPLFARIFNGTASPLHAIEGHCLTCRCLRRREIATCDDSSCTLWHHRPTGLGAKEGAK